MPAVRWLPVVLDKCLVQCITDPYLNITLRRILSKMEQYWQCIRIQSCPFLTSLFNQTVHKYDGSVTAADIFASMDGPWHPPPMCVRKSGRPQTGRASGGAIPYLTLWPVFTVPVPRGRARGGAHGLAQAR
eukprot:scaffold148458_cov49-Prasinocladus_malaysianus.AAC.1